MHDPTAPRDPLAPSPQQDIPQGEGQIATPPKADPPEEGAAEESTSAAADAATAHPFEPFTPHRLPRATRPRTVPKRCAVTH